MELMNLPDANVAQVALDTMINDFRKNAELPRAVMIIGSKCFLDAKAPDYHRRAITILEKVIQEFPKTEAMTGMYDDVYCCAADCYFEMGDFTKALSYYNKLVAEYPDSKASWYSLYKTGQVYEKLGETGQISIPEAQTQTRLAYEQLLRKYPTCKEADSARIWLNQHKSATGGQN